MSNTPHPLRTYDCDGEHSQTVATELRMAAETIEKTATADIHSHEDMIRSAIVLRIRLNHLAAAVNAERVGAR